MAPNSRTPPLPGVGSGVSAAHRRRLRDVYRSAGWPCHDAVEIELLAAGLLERVVRPSGHETVCVTDAGLRLIADTLQQNRARRDAHETLVERVAREMTRAGRIAWLGPSRRTEAPMKLRREGDSNSGLPCPIA